MIRKTACNTFTGSFNSRGYSSLVASCSERTPSAATRPVSSMPEKAIACNHPRGNVLGGEVPIADCERGHDVK